MDNISNSISIAIIVLYLLLVAGLGLVGLVSLAILHKHAEKKSVATGISMVFMIIFTIIFLVSLKPLSNL